MQALTDQQAREIATLAVERRDADRRLATQEALGQYMEARETRRELSRIGPTLDRLLDEALAAGQERGTVA
jgi:hypothetical protein